MSIPDKRTLLAAILYGLAPQQTIEVREDKQTLAWGHLSLEAQKPFVAASEYLLGQSFGVDLRTLSRPNLAARFEEQKLIDVDANMAVSAFVNVVSVLP